MNALLWFCFTLSGTAALALEMLWLRSAALVLGRQCPPPHSGAVLAYVFGQRKDAVLQELKKLLQPFGIKRFYADHWGAYAGS